MIKTISKKKKSKKAKQLSEEALQITEKRKEAKGKEEKERYAHLNAEFQRIARRDKKAFLSDQRKKQRKTRDLFKREHFMHISLSLSLSLSPVPRPGDLPHPGIEHGSPALQADSL